MKTSVNTLLIAFVMVFAFSTIMAPALAGNNPVDEKWWPGEYGPDDTLGATQQITPAKRVAAAKLVKQGKIATLGMPYYNGMPLVPGRTYAMSIPSGGGPTHGPLSWPGDQFGQTFMDELLTAEIGQVGTQWDGLGHSMIRIEGVEGWDDGDYFYNGYKLKDVGGPRGLKKVGTEHIASVGYFTRGILIDIAALKGVGVLDKGYSITLDDYQAAFKAQGIDDASAGDVVLFRTGWSTKWGNPNLTPAEHTAINAEVGSGEPGVSPEICDYLIELRKKSL